MEKSGGAEVEVAAEEDWQQGEKIKNWSMLSRVSAIQSPNLPNFKSGGSPSAV